MNTVLVLVFVLFHLASMTPKKPGNFGMFTVCIQDNKTLQMDCWYPPCTGSPPFHCSFLTEQGQELGNTLLVTVQNESVLYFTEAGVCRLLLTDPHVNKTSRYTCKLTRRKTTEKKKFTVNRRTVKVCSDVGLLTPRLLLPTTSIALLMEYMP